MHWPLHFTQTSLEWSQLVSPTSLIPVGQSTKDGSLPVHRNSSRKMGPNVICTSAVTSSAPVECDTTDYNWWCLNSKYTDLLSGNQPVGYRPLVHQEHWRMYHTQYPKHCWYRAPPFLFLSTHHNHQFHFLASVHHHYRNQHLYHQLWTRES